MDLLAADMLAALALQVAWGADEALDALPVDRMAPLPPAVPPPILPRAPALAAVPKIGLAARARVAAEAANTPEALLAALTAFTDCPLALTATKLVFADGNPACGLVVVGEVPGEEEDRSGRPFAGAPGLYLDRMFASIGLSRADMLLTSLIPWRPPGGRQVSEAEVQAGLPFLLRHLTLLRPRLVVTMGTNPARTLTGRADTLRRLRGRWYSLQVPGLPDAIPTLPMLHPSYVQQTPSVRRDCWADLITLKRALNAL